MSIRCRLPWNPAKRPDRFTRPPLPEWLDPNRWMLGASYSLKCSYNYWTKMYWAMPPWLSDDQIDEIRDIYENAEPGYHVDHIVPLKSPLVCGLHVPWNLETIPDKANLHKSNDMWPDHPNEPMRLF